MKNNKALIALFVAVIVCLTCLFTACNDNSQDARDPQIVAIYNSYVADAAEKGETPLSYEEWLNSIKGAKGDTGATGAKGDDGAQGPKGDKGDNGVDGKSAYDLWKEANPDSTLTLEQWLESLKGSDGQNGTNGTNGTNGVDGKSAYELWKEANPESTLTLEQWLESLIGANGEKGEKGDKGDTGAQGEQGIQGEKGDKGDKGDTGAQGEQGIQGEKGDKGDKGDTGAQGEQGIQGEKGDKGDKGDTGAQGEQGIQGEKGDKGDKGETGATGRIGFIVSTADQFKAAVTVDNAYVLLASDITVDSSVVVNKNVVIDLGGHTLTATGRNALQVSGENAYAIVKNGNVVATNGGGLWGIEQGTLVVEDLNVTAQENSLGAHQAGNVIVNGGTYTSKDNFVVLTNGSKGYGGSKIVINGGTFNGNIQTAGYIAGGIYVANSDEVIVNGGTFNVTNGVGIVARSGKTVVGENVVINLIEGSDKAGWVGDKKINIPTGKELVLDLASDYPGGQPSIENDTSYSVFTVNAASTADELVALIADTSVDNIVIANDIVVTNELKVGASRVCTVDLNGHTVSLVYADGVTPNDGGVFNVRGKGSHLTINDSSKDQTGKVVGSDKTFANRVTCAVRAGNNSKLTINGGHFYGTSENTSCIFVYTSRASGTKATVVINGGTFETANSEGKIAYVLNHQDSLTAGCTITVNGGTFKNYNPGVTAVDPSNAYTGKIVLGTGCKTTETTDGTDTWYTVSK